MKKHQSPTKVALATLMALGLAGQAGAAINVKVAEVVHNGVTWELLNDSDYYDDDEPYIQTTSNWVNESASNISHNSTVDQALWNKVKSQMPDEAAFTGTVVDLNSSGGTVSNITSSITVNLDGVSAEEFGERGVNGLTTTGNAATLAGDKIDVKATLNARGPIHLL